MNRIILHIDFDYFYAQLEELRKPELKGRPVAVCMFSGRSEYSGAVATANYEAREKGVKSGMPIGFAKKQCPGIELLKADREYYSEVSERLMDIMREFSDKFEQVSIDEAYLDVSEKTGGSFAEARKLALEVKKKIMDEEKLTCSIGAGPNKLIAKMASAFKKPDGLTIVSQGEVKEFLRGMRIKDLHGIGPKTVEALKEKGISTIPQLAEAPVHGLKEIFGENKGALIHEKSLGMDDSPVEEREKQQYSRMKTLKEDTKSAEEILKEAGEMAQELAKLSAENSVRFKTISIILVSPKLETITRSRTLERQTQKKEEIDSTARELINEFFSENQGFVARRFGVRVSNFSRGEKQKSIFDF